MGDFFTKTPGEIPVFFRKTPERTVTQKAGIIIGRTPTGIPPSSQEILTGNSGKLIEGIPRRIP